MNENSLMTRLADLDPAAFADADKSIRVISSAIRPVQSGARLLGRAYTVRCDSDFLAVILALDEARPGDVLVIDTQGSTVAVVGELFSLEAARIGLAGIVIDGACRDVSTIRTLSMPVYSRSITPVSGTVNAPGERQVPVNCGGVTVSPGDILFGDDDGIVVATPAELESLLDAAVAIKQTETAVIEQVRQGRSLLSLMNYAEHRARVEAGEPGSQLKFDLP